MVNGRRAAPTRQQARSNRDTTDAMLERATRRDDATEPEDSYEHAAEGGKAAARLEILFKNIHGYWTDKKIADATTAAETAVTSLQTLQKALAANDMTAAETARATFAGTCMTCHTAHREKLPEGGFRIK